MTPLPYTLTVDDLVYGSRLAMRRQLATKWWKFMLFIAAVAAAVPMAIVIWNGWNAAKWFEGFRMMLAIYLPLGLAFWLFIYFWLVGKRARKQFRQAPMLSREQRVHWDDEKMFFESANGTTHFDINELHQVCADDQILLLYPADHIFYVLPRRLFESDAQFNSLVSRVKQSGAKWL